MSHREGMLSANVHRHMIVFTRLPWACFVVYLGFFAYACKGEDTNTQHVYVHACIYKNPLCLPSPSTSLPLSLPAALPPVPSSPSTRLQWDLEGMQADLEESKANLTRLISDSDLVVMSTYGKAIPKKCKLSPDGWFQVHLLVCIHGCN